jgi:hypothetical protein
MTGYKRVFLGYWVSLDEQDRVCEVSLDRSTVEEVSEPSDQQIDYTFQACKSPIGSAMNRLLSCLLSVAVESRYAAKEMYRPILSLYSKIAPPFPSRMMPPQSPPPEKRPRPERYTGMATRSSSRTKKVSSPRHQGESR